LAGLAQKAKTSSTGCGVHWVAVRVSGMCGVVSLGSGLVPEYRRGRGI